MNRFACFLIVICVQFSVLLSSAQSNKQDSTVTRLNDSTSMQNNLDPYVRALQNERNRIFEKLEIESEFPGGPNAWSAFLNTHLVYPQKAIRKKIEGTVLLGFIINKDGSISDLKALDGDPILQDAALKVMQESPKWKPSIQNGWLGKSYKRQPIVFRLSSK
jgi:periplasmic protein TonB